MAANPQANSQYETNKLPGFNKEPFDGKPVHFFDMIWFIPFIVACGNIQQDGWTLHQTYYGNDLGEVNCHGDAFYRTLSVLEYLMLCVDVRSTPSVHCVWGPGSLTLL